MTPLGGTVLGIDFGTTHTVAVLGDTPLLFDASPLLVSAVAAAPDGGLLTGRDAQRGALQDPSRFEPNPKLRVDEGRVLLGGVEYEVEELVAAPLRRVAAEAARVLGGPPARTVLTYPASWAARRRDVLLRAAGRAGLPDVSLVPEPVAAAVHHAAGLSRPVRAGAVVAVYDLGGGTFDVTLLRHDAPGWSVVATTGLENVGGIDLDAALVDHLGATVGAREPRRWRRLVEPADPAGRRVLQAFRDDVRGAKEQLSRAASTVVRVPGFEVDAYLSREEFEAVAGPWLTRTVDVLAALAAQAGVARLDGLYLVGGSSRIPLVATLLHRRFAVAPTLVEQPELVVALGSVHVPAVPEPVPPAAVLPSTSAHPLAPPPATHATTTTTTTPPPFASPAQPPPAPSSTQPPQAPGWHGAPPAAVPHRVVTPGRGRTGPVGAAVAVLVVVALLLAWQHDWDGSDDGQGDRSSGSTAGSTAGNGAGNGGKQSLRLDKTAFYAGFRIDFVAVTYEPGADGPVRVELKVGNRGREDADLLHITVPMTVRFGDTAVEGNYVETRRVGARSDADAVMAFPVRGAVRLADGVLTVGDNDRLTSQVPFKAGAAVTTLPPAQILAPARVVTDGLTFTDVTCELRGDFLDAHRQVSAKERAIGCSFNVSYSGTRYAGVGPDGLRLVMPDGSVRAPERYPAFHLADGEERRDQSVEFVFGWPVPGEGSFALRVFDGDLRTPDRKDLPLTVPKAGS
ncbi:Hsp70 family protein [Dactylosporangium sp. NPDC049525]|uniref:Hsp70 family protein n=1 Tax=Dactylosporangium sp. NPDC049525 TaxID=3154730 RepID=UPI003414CF0A